jgi:hypothetical protein
MQTMSASDPKALGSGSAPETPTATKKPLSPAAERALAEAAARRAANKPAEQQKTEGSPDPARYGDWENKGLAKDF